MFAGKGKEGKATMWADDRLTDLHTQHNSEALLFPDKTCRALLSNRKCQDLLLRRTQRLRLRSLWNNVRNELDQRAEPAQEVVVNHPITLGHMGKVHQLHCYPTPTSACCDCSSIIAQKNRRRVEVEQSLLLEPRLELAQL